MCMWCVGRCLLQSWIGLQNLRNLHVACLGGPGWYYCTSLTQQQGLQLWLCALSSPSSHKTNLTWDRRYEKNPQNMRKRWVIFWRARKIPLETFLRWEILEGLYCFVAGYVPNVILLSRAESFTIHIAYSDNNPQIPREKNLTSTIFPRKVVGRKTGALMLLIVDVVKFETSTSFKGNCSIMVACLYIGYLRQRFQYSDCVFHYKYKLVILPITMMQMCFISWSALFILALKYIIVTKAPNNLFSKIPVILDKILDTRKNLLKRLKGWAFSHFLRHVA